MTAKGAAQQRFATYYSVASHTDGASFTGNQLGNHPIRIGEGDR